MPSSPENIFSEKNLTEGTSIQTKTLEELKSKLGSKDFDGSGPGGIDPSLEMIPESPNRGMTTTTHSAHGRLLPPPPMPMLSEDGLILPRKPANPCLESQDRLNLHRELLFNQKIGKNVLNQKSELQRALEKHKDNQAKKELENQSNQSTPELEKVIADRAKRLQDVPVQNEDDKGLNKEFLQVRAKLRARNDSK